MSNAAYPAGQHLDGDGRVGSPPPMPSIAASALLESRRLVTLARRTVAALLVRG